MGIFQIDFFPTERFCCCLFLFFLCCGDMEILWENGRDSYQLSMESGKNSWNAFKEEEFSAFMKCA
jgi:hypothetical protein